jgi:hypothetical protein
MRREPHRLVFVDETATTTKMTRLRGRARHHQRLKARTPFGHWRTQTFIAALRCDGLTAPINGLAFDLSTSGRATDATVIAGVARFEHELIQ